MHRKNQQRISVALVALVISFSAWAGGHDSDLSNAAKYRHTVMEALGSQFSAFVMVFTNRVDHPEDLQPHADALAATAATVSNLFGEGSEGGDALPIIWEEPDKVAEASAELEKQTAALAAAVRSGDKAATAQAFKGAGQACKGCHERYKEEDD